MKHLLYAAMVIIGTLSFSSHAGFIATDWKASGDKKATLDTDTGLEWLDINLTKGKSINEVSLLIDNGTYSGWRLPSKAEVVQLMANFYPNPAISGSQLATKTAEFAGLFGVTYFNSNNSVWSYALYKDTDAGPNRIGYAGSRYHADQGIVYPTTLASFMGFSSGYAQYGVFLVSDGGVTLSSINDPSINANNPSSPANANQPDVSDVGSPVLAGMFFLPFLMLFRRRSPQR